MCKCSNCYWKDRTKYSERDWCGYYHEKPDKCLYFEYECEICGNDPARWDYNGDYYCFDCLIRKLGVEECTTVEYYKDGEYLGSDEDINEVVDGLNENIYPLTE